MTLDAESLQKQIPYYLTASDQKALVAELRSFSDGASPDYFLSEYNDTFKEVRLQGDGWVGFELFVFETGNRHSVRGIILSNSCDISTENKRDVPSRIVFAPLVKLSSYKALLDKSGIDDAAVSAKIAAIKAQKTTNMFFLPSGGALDEDYVARFDDVHSMPVTAHKEPTKLFTLSMIGFYLLVLKLSVHFCRLQENVNRGSASTVEA